MMHDDSLMGTAYYRLKSPTCALLENRKYELLQHRLESAL